MADVSIIIGVKVSWNQTLRPKGKKEGGFYHYYLFVFCWSCSSLHVFVDEVAVGLDVSLVALRLHGNMGPGRRPGG